MDLLDSRNVLTETFNLNVSSGIDPEPIKAHHTIDADRLSASGNPQIIEARSIRDLSFAIKMQNGGHVTCAFSADVHESLLNPPDEVARLEIEMLDGQGRRVPIALVELNMSKGVLQALGPESFKITALQEKSDGKLRAYPIALEEYKEQYLSISNIPPVNAPQNSTVLTPQPIEYKP